MGLDASSGLWKKYFYQKWRGIGFIPSPCIHDIYYIAERIGGGGSCCLGNYFLAEAQAKPSSCRTSIFILLYRGTLRQSAARRFHFGKQRFDLGQSAGTV
jgi:hypothetical protein